MKIMNSLLFDYHNDCVDINGNIVYRQLYSRSEAEEYKSEVVPARLTLEEDIAESIHNSSSKRFILPGYSETAGEFVQFDIDLNYSDGRNPNFRERLVCPVTRLNNRQRFISHYVQKVATEHSYTSMFLFEQSTPVYKYLSSRLQDTIVLGSEYLGLGYSPGEIRRGGRHEDATTLTFTDESFDMVLALDILSKVPDLKAAIREIARVIKAGGRFIFSVPFTNENKTLQRATYIDKQIEHLQDPKYHFNSHTGEERSLVFYDIGWDVLETLKDNGFKEAYQLAYYSASFGYLGEGFQFIFIAEK